MSSPLDPITAGLNLGGKIIDTFFESTEQKNEYKLKLFDMAQRGELAVLQAGSAAVVAEAQSESWIASNWRPIVMITFTALIVARWFGLAAPNLSEAEYLKLWGIVEFGLGGYVVGRSVEKISGQVTETLANMRGK
jgi:hypothetical protein